MHAAAAAGGGGGGPGAADRAQPLLGGQHGVGAGGAQPQRRQRQPPAAVIESRWVSQPLAFAGGLRPPRPNDQPPAAGTSIGGESLFFGHSTLRSVDSFRNSSTTVQLPMQSLLLTRDPSRGCDHARYHADTDWLCTQLRRHRHPIRPPTRTLSRTRARALCLSLSARLSTRLWMPERW
jgi:hypothetical protein